MTNYLTVAEYRASSTGQDTSNLIAGGNGAAQDAELLRKIGAASEWIDQRAGGQSLIAASRVELIRCRYQRDGTLSVHPRVGHLNELVAVAVGTNLNDLAVVSTSGAFIDQEQWIISAGTGLWTSVGPLQFGASPSARVLVKVTHVAGWPNTTLTNNPGVAATSITVADGSGFAPALGSVVADDRVRIIDGEFTETVTVTAVNGLTLTVTPLQNAHSAGAVVSALPGDLKEAASLATSAFLRARTSDAMVLAQTAQVGGQPQRDAQRWQLLADAGRIIDNYARVR